ncbi:nitroreductase family protein [Methylobacterium haplocladii]|uniref:Nitroreductase n=1 Tax=Methylobacterium haplocladii TaxID=1176176 RepID=A0A512IMF6_9HYPH|nr:nitroreductase family protein [Methylobacterium haplocladii]GEO98899.1 nitroreductase [Methylobacterium haplocladii]GJD85084.1 malonic semialdehyde reductase RutE [Methylobacterium haplocladii]GLS58112.1 nitroreductase [Methylobacterium haplocladii]
MTEPNPRNPDHAIDPLFTERWSPRAFTGEAVPESELLRMLEAARWSPSSYNSQPWRFVYALRGTPEWQTFFDLIVPGNQKWVQDTGAILFIASSEKMKVGDELKPSASHSFDAGAAWQSLALQATRQGWHAHAMGGFDRERAPEVLRLPAEHRIEAAIAIGRKTPHDSLTEEQRERGKPTGRRPITDFAFKGGFPPEDA